MRMYRLSRHSHCSLQGIRDVAALGCPGGLQALFEESPAESAKFEMAFEDSLTAM